MGGDHYLRFGIFETYPGARELRRRGIRIALPPKAFALLEALLERPGEIVTREALRQRLWPDTHVDFDRGLNNAVNRLRIALGDHSRAPRFVETVTGRGYRFVAQVERVSYGAPPLRNPSRGPASRSHIGRLMAAGTTAILALVTVSSARPPTTSGSAPSPGRSAYLAGLYHYNRHRPDALLEARRRFEEALAIDPSLAAAHAGLALASLDLLEWRLDSRAELEKTARAAARQAAQLDPSLPEAYLALARVHAWLDWRWDEAEREVRVAIGLNPASPGAFGVQAELLAAQGRLPEALEAVERASALEPLSVWTHARAGRLLYLARRFDAAVDRLRLAAAMDPGAPAAHKWLSDAYWHTGLARDAAVELQAWLESLDVADVELQRVRRTLEAQGMIGLWRENGRRGESAAGRDGMPFKLASFYASAGDDGPALEWLARALDQGDRQLLYVALDPTFDELRHTPRFQQLLGSVQRRFGLRSSA